MSVEEQFLADQLDAMDETRQRAFPVVMIAIKEDLPEVGPGTAAMQALAVLQTADDETVAGILGGAEE